MKLLSRNLLFWVRDLFLLLSLLIVVTILIERFSNEEDIIYFIRSFSRISGTFLAGMLTSIAIIFALMGENELKNIYKFEIKKSRHYYEDIVKKLKYDTYFIIFAVGSSALISVFSSNKETVHIGVYKISFQPEIYKLLFILDFAIFIMSLIIIFDFITTIYDIGQFKYEVIKNHKKSEDEE